MYKAVIFDFFDVIRTDALKHWMNKYGYKLKGELLAANLRMDHGEIDVETFMEQLGEIVGRPAGEINAEMEADTSVDWGCTWHSRTSSSRL